MGGAGKDPAAGARAVADRDEDIFDLLKRSWGDMVAFPFVCLGAAGGTGAGTAPKTIEVVKRYMQTINRPVRCGAIIALPKDAEGQQPAANAVQTAQKLQQLGLSPVIIVDNQRVSELYRPTLKTEHATENSSAISMLHLFNRLAAQNSSHTTFDKADLAKVLDSGVVAFGASVITDWTSESAISQAIRDQLKKNILAAVDLSKGKTAALILSPAARRTTAFKPRRSIMACKC